MPCRLQDPTQHCRVYRLASPVSSFCSFSLFFFFFFSGGSRGFPCGKFGSPCLGKAITAARATLPIPNNVCGIFVYPNKRMGFQWWRSLTCLQMLAHAIAHEGCTDTVRESPLKVDCGRKILCCTGKSELPQRRAGPTFYQPSYIPAPFSCDGHDD